MGRHVTLGVCAAAALVLWAAPGVPASATATRAGETCRASASF